MSKNSKQPVWNEKWQEYEYTDVEERLWKHRRRLFRKATKAYKECMKDGIYDKFIKEDLKRK